MAKHLLAIAAFVLLLRLPFLNTAAQWDDYNYLSEARYALTDPAHPSHIRFVFQGEWFTMAGHPHPPGTAWFLAGAMALLGPFREIPFHLATIPLSLIAAFSMFALARRWIPERALEATLLFLAVPAAVVSSTSLESDLPLLALWMLAVALFVEGVERDDVRCLAGAALATMAATMMAYTAFLLAVVFGLYLWTRGVRRLAPWLVLLSPFLSIGGYQLYERMTSGTLPAAALAANFQAYGLQRLQQKLMNAAALTGHLGLMLSPILTLPCLGLWPLLGTAAAFYDVSPLFWVPIGLGFGILIWTARQLRGQRFLAGWVLLYFAAALVIFFAGAARYLLPLAAPLALLVTVRSKQRPILLWCAIAANAFFALSLAYVNAWHWDATRDIARRAMGESAGHRVWVSGEWGLREYTEQLGARPLVRNQVLAAGDRLISSELSGHKIYANGGNRIQLLRTYGVQPPVPLRIAGLDSKTAYATVGFGLRALGWTNTPVDRIQVLEAVAAPVSLSWLPMNVPEAEWQIVSGVYSLEQGQWRWAGKEAVVRLAAPSKPARVRAQVHVPEVAPGRELHLSVNGKELAVKNCGGPGDCVIESAEIQPAGVVEVKLSVDRDFRPAGDIRSLGFILKAVGFPPSQ